MSMRRTSGVYLTHAPAHARAPVPMRTGMHVGEMVDTGHFGSRCAEAAAGDDGLKRDLNDLLHSRLKSYMQGFMNDPSHTGADGSPPGRSSWPLPDGSPTDGVTTDVWDSPLGHRKFFEWRARGSGGVLTKGTMEDTLNAIGVDLSVCGKSVAEGLMHAMTKSGDDGHTTWPEYLNSMFRVGPASDSKAPDPTVAQITMETGAPPPSDTSKKGMILGGALLAAVNKAAAPSTQRSSTGIPKNAKINPAFLRPAILDTPHLQSKTPAIAGAVLAGGLLAIGAPFPLAALPLAIGTMIVYGGQRESV